ALLSITIGWPSFFVAASPRIRKPASAGPPAAQGMIRRTGRSGKRAWACVGATALNGRTDAPTRAVLRVIEVIRLDPPVLPTLPAPCLECRAFRAYLRLP